MTAKQRKFCDEYLVSGNATQAAVKAGYSKKTAKQTGTENLSKPDIRAYIDGELEKLHSEKIADADEVLRYLTAVMRGESMSSVLALCGDGCQESMAKAPDEKERLKAAELMGRRYGLFTDKLDLDGHVQVIFENENELTD